MGLFARLWLALVCFFRIAFDAEFADKVQNLRAPPPPPLQRGDRATLPATPTAITAQQLVRGEQALLLLSMLQREGRLIDFCEEELAGFPDAQIGAAARTVHSGCRKALREVLTLKPIRSEPEGGAVELPGGFDPRAIRLTGSITGNPPFKGVLKHHGWRVAEMRMPAGSGDPTVIAPAEVELP